MDVEIPPGKYIIAVSGGVDSMVLLNILYKKISTEAQSQNIVLSVVVAHFNHGIRQDSKADETLVQKTAKKYNLPFEVGYGRLGKNASEQKARNRRYKFLETIKTKYSADAIITAHHQDDFIETAFLNILRGSGHRGLAAMKVNQQVKRPLLHVNKESILRYANKHRIKWIEDSTNQDESYLRNYIRINLLSDMSEEQKQYLIKNIEKVADIVAEKDILVAKISQNIMNNNTISRSKYIMLPAEIRYEVIMYWLRSNGYRNYEKQNIEKIDIALKTGKAGTKLSIKKQLWLKLSLNSARFDSQD
jgi:tRNA(Ile)-lysidine synthetase-like protein